MKITRDKEKLTLIYSETCIKAYSGTLSRRNFKRL